MTKKNTKETKKKGNTVAIAFMNLIKVILIVIAVIFVVAKAEKIMTKADAPDITNKFISSKLETVSELTSAKLTYNGLVRYKEGKIPFITKKEFAMIYNADIRAGIDMEDVDIEVTDKEVKILLPKVEVLEITVDSDSIDFYDEKFAVFNWNKKEDVTEALKLAEEDVEKNANIDELKVKAEQQIDKLLNGLFEGIIGERKLIIEYKNQ